MSKVLLLNLPNEERITRRYMCSYASPDSLMPPVELLAVGAIAREWKGATAKLVDCIAEELNYGEAIEQINDFNPELIVTLTGFECFEEDLKLIRKFKNDLPGSKIVVFGHYATHFKKETLLHSGADFVIHGEPDLIFADLYDALQGNRALKDVEGIAYSLSDQIVEQGTGSRIPNPNELPMPAYDLLPENKYFEPLMKRPYGMIQTARGCPYQCNYCVKSYGTKLTTLEPERIVEEIKMWKKLLDVRSIRFIDDTFTINRKRIIQLCQLIIKEDLHVEWACLSRTDNLDDELLNWMKKAGCTRIYFGLESGSQRVLDHYKKNINVEDAIASLHLCRKNGIETAGFFMGGYPEETEEDFQQTIQFAIRAKLNYASFNPLTPYPGTDLYNKVKDSIDFSIFPYKNVWKDKSIYDRFDERKNRFYKAFYLRPSYVTTNISQLAANMAQITQMGIGLLRYLWWDKKFVISGLKGAKDE